MTLNPVTAFTGALDRKRFLSNAKLVKILTSREYGEAYPLTVEVVQLWRSGHAVWIQAGGVRYPLNGAAMTLLPHFGISARDLRDIWRLSPAFRLMVSGLSSEDAKGLVPWYMSVAGLIKDGLAK